MPDTSSRTPPFDAPVTVRRGVPTTGSPAARAPSKAASGARCADVRARAAGAERGLARQYAAKRTLDVIGAGLLLLLLAPLLVLVALGIRLSSPGAIIYRSRRVGLGGQQFDCYKLRTMRTGADLLQAELEQLNEAAGPIFKLACDPRVTPIGRWLRSSGIDELPQLINVLRGEMSMVGPRPLPLRDCANLTRAGRRRHEVLPGISGVWQLYPSRHAGDRLLERLDLWYIDNWSLGLDIRTMLSTIVYALRRLFTMNSDLLAGG